MTKMIAVLMIAILLGACAGDGQGKGGAAEVRRQAREAIQHGTATPPEAEDAEAFKNNIQLMLPKGTIAAGATECFEIKAGTFKNILAMQYTLQWDKSILTYAGVKEFKLPFMSNENFGSTLGPQGILTSVWIENSLKGVSVPDGSAIYQICFKAIGKPGQASDLSVTSKPTAIEVVTIGDQVWGIESAPGRITIQ